MKLQINITQEILQKTKNCSVFNGDMGTSCAIAEAVRDIFPNAQVSEDCIRFAEASSKGAIQLNFRSEVIYLPLKAVAFIQKFDKFSPSERIKMEPISFEIIVPDSLIEDIDISEVEEILKTSLTLQLV